MTPVKAWRSLNPQQKRSGLAGWLGWMFDGLDLHLYTLVATPFVATLLMLPQSDPNVATKGSIIQAAFLAGWALGGAFFGIFGDKLGRSRTLVLTILCYSVFCGLSSLAQNWWQLMICRFLSALGIGGEWAVGAALIAETFPKSLRRPWLAGILQCGVNVGILIACGFGIIWGNWALDPRYIFLVGAAPALITLWIRRSVPEPEEWHNAQQHTGIRPGIRDLFAPGLKSTTWRVLFVCAFGLTAHWAFMFWQQLFIRNHVEVKYLDKSTQNTIVAWVLALIVGSSVIGNFLSSWLAVRWGYARALVLMSVVYGSAMWICFNSHFGWSFSAVMWWFALIGLCQGLFGLYTMCLPPMFPTLLRTTGAGFCYNFGRLAAAGGTIFFGIFNKPGDTGDALFYASLLFIPTALLCLYLPKPKEEA